MRRDQKLLVDGHLLLCCEAGQVLLERGPQSVILRAGQGCVISDTEVTVSELPLTGYDAGLFCYFSFHDRTLADLTSMHPRSMAFILTGCDYPTYTPGMAPFDHGVLSFSLRKVSDAADTDPQIDYLVKQMLQGYGPVPETPVHPYQQPHVLRQALTVAKNRMKFPFLRLWSERVVVPRLRIMLFLESCTMLADSSHPELFDRFEGGAKALRQAMRNLAMPPAESVIRSRRFEIAHSWHVYGGNPLPLIAGALRVRNPSRFIGDYGRWVAETKPFAFRGLDLGNYNDRILAATYPPLAPLFGEYWRRRERQEQKDAGIIDPYEKLWEDDMELLKQHNPAVYEATIANPPKPHPMPFEIGLAPGHEDEGFMRMESTGIVMALRALRVSERTGLEDCESLLVAA